MGHLINPITYRLGKTKFWTSVWSNNTRKNYKNFLFEDFNLHSFLNWVLAVLSWNKIGIFVSDFNLVKSFDSVNISFFFFINRLKLFSNLKKNFYKFFLKNNFLSFFFKVLLNKRFLLFNNFNKKKVFFLNANYLKLIKNKKLYYKKKKALKIFSKLVIGAKKKKKNKKKQWLSSFLFRYCFFSLKKSKQFKKQYLNVFNSYFLNKNLNRSIFLNFKLYNNISILQKNSSFRSFNYNFFFSILSLFLSFFLKKVFKHSNFLFNFFKKDNHLRDAKSIKQFVSFNMKKNRSRMTQVIKKVFKKTRKKYNILGLKIGFFGRYEKKLRNKNVWQSRGSLSPSNINTPITHKNFCILLKQGLCGVKVSFLSKLEKNEIFKKKTFTSKAFKIR